MAEEISNAKAIDTSKTKELILQHYQMYPGMQVEDCIKLLYQNEFGAEHLMESTTYFEDRLQKEISLVATEKPLPHVDIGDGLFRVNLSGMCDDISVQTLAKLCVLSAQNHTGDKNHYLQKLAILQEMIESASLPYTQKDINTIKNHISEGCPAVHHSERFRELYQPHYRLLDLASVLYLPVFMKLDKALCQKSHVFAGIDGMCASGKSSLATFLQYIYGCSVIHADDFFLQPHQRTPERLVEVGGNIDYERLSEVVDKAAKGIEFSYSRFCCMKQALDEEKTVMPTSLTVLEGAYCLHPKVNAACDVRVFLSTYNEVQKARISNRETKEMAERFKDEWIPKEHAYFAAYAIRESCDVIVDTSSL